MMEHIFSFPNHQVNEAFIVNSNDLGQIDNYFTMESRRFEKQTNDFSNIIQTQKLLLINQVYFNLQQNNTLIEALSNKIDLLDQSFQKIQSQFKKIGSQVPEMKKHQNYSTEEDSIELNQEKKVRKLHFKDLFREKMFGAKQYKYKLNVQGKVPTVFYKERNISLKIDLSDLTQKTIRNENAISLHFKVFYSNGEEIGDTKKGQNFMKGSLNSTLINGKAIFDKLYPREVSRKLEKKKIVLVIYASGMGMGDTLLQCINKVDPLQVEPLIIYGIQVITKQNKEQKPKKDEMQISQCDSEFTL